MAHNEEEYSGKIKHICIDVLDDGTFVANYQIKKKEKMKGEVLEPVETKKYSYDSINGLIRGLKECFMGRKEKSADKENKLEKELSNKYKKEEEE